jgi:alpha-tubulin suppressor-like RCC1 family protein
MKFILTTLLVSVRVLVAATSQGVVVGWGANPGGGAPVPTIGVPFLSNAVSIAAGESHGLALLADGTVYCWGWGEPPQGNKANGLVKVDDEVLRNVKAITAGAYCGLALKSDGRLVGWDLVVPSGLSNVMVVDAGNSHWLVLNVDGTIGGWPGLWGDRWDLVVPSGLSNVMAVAAGFSHWLVLNDDGTIRGWPGLWGDRPPELNANSPTVQGLAAQVGMEFATNYAYRDKLQPRHGVMSGVSNAVGIAVSQTPCGSTLVLRNDGKVLAWNYRGGVQVVPEGLSNVVEIAAGGYENLALKSDGTVEAWANDGAKIHLPADLAVPAGLSDVAAIAAGFSHCLALKRDGSMVAWGDNSWHQTDVPPGLTNIVAIAAGDTFSLAIQSKSSLPVTNELPFFRLP